MQGIRELKPFSKSHNTIKKPVVYLTPNETLALFYIWDRAYKFVTFEEDGRGVVVYTEWYENQFEDLTGGLRGSVYECRNASTIYETHITGVYNSDVPVPVAKETVIDDVPGEICKRIADGRVVMRRYSSLTETEKEEIQRTMVRAIHLERLLEPDGSEPTIAKAAFVKERFPASWSIAEQMSAEEIEATLAAWRKTR